MDASNGDHETRLKDTFLRARTRDGASVEAPLQRLSRHAAVFEFSSPGSPVRMSEALDACEIVFQDRVVYSGRAVVRTLLDLGRSVTCEVQLDEKEWMGSRIAGNDTSGRDVAADFGVFLREWQKVQRVSREYKLVVADLQSFLADLHLWLGRLEADITASSPEERQKLRIELAETLRLRVGSALGSMFERFETVCGEIEEEAHPAHRVFGRRQLHPYLLCAPFIHRTYVKPLGYAGDYEMMNMIVRNRLEGESLYAMLVNAYLLDQIGPQAVRNRVSFLLRRIVEEASRVSARGGVASVYSIACGPAREAREFIAGHSLADATRFELLDFNDETLRYTERRMNEVRERHHRKTPVSLVRKSVQSLLMANSKRTSMREAYDLIYCSGLYDYLNPQVCRALSTYLYDLLLPGGLLVVGNFAPNTPVRNFIEHFLEWFLIYRDGKELTELGPAQVAKGDCVICAEPTTTNIFMEVRKPL